MTDLVPGPTSADGRVLSRRGAETRRRLLEAAERCFADTGYHDASIVKITETAGVAQGTFYLYFDSKKAIFDELVLDLNRRVRHFVTEQAKHGTTRVEQEVLGFRAFFRFTAEHPALYRIIRQAEFVSPEVLQRHYELWGEGYGERLGDAMANGEIADADPAMLTWALMGIAELVGMRTVLWADNGEIADADFAALTDILKRTLGAA